MSPSQTPQAITNTTKKIRKIKNKKSSHDRTKREEIGLDFSVKQENIHKWSHSLIRDAMLKSLDFGEQWLKTLDVGEQKEHIGDERKKEGQNLKREIYLF